MSHPLLKAAIRFFFISILLILPVKIAGACSCGPTPNVLEAYEAADEVLIVRMLSLQKVEHIEGVRPYIDSQPAIVRVERVYKGKSGVTDQLVFGTGFLGCSRMFDQDAIGKEFLVYLKRPKYPTDHWYASYCDRSNKLQYAREDLLYLDNQQNLRGKTRVSGMILGTQFELLSVANRKIRIIGSQKTYETNTDENGVYEVYDLPPGQYRIEPELPVGWKFFGWYPRSTTSVSGRFKPGESGRFVLEPNKHASINMMFRPDSSVAGKIVGPNGIPDFRICAHLWRPDQIDGPSDSACTNEKGHFLFDSVVPGTYVLVINPTNEPDSSAPYPRLFYPGTEDREKAVLIDVDVGQKVRGINMVVPLLETVKVEGVLYFANDVPARNQSVLFLPATKNGVEGLAQTNTDNKGRFSFRVIKGLAGNVIAETHIFAGIFENCPAVDALVKDSPQKNVQINTPAIRVEAQTDIRNLVLRFPFPMCKSKD
jgi:hypothetical protein